MELAVRGTVFAAAGTAGQRCTTVRRLIVHESIYDVLLDRLSTAYRSLRIGDPWDRGVLVGPLIHEAAVDAMMAALEAAKSQGVSWFVAAAGSIGPASSSSRRS